MNPLSSREEHFHGQEEITHASPEAWVRKGLAYVPQVDNVFPSLTVEENLEMGAFVLSGDLKERKERVFRLFHRLLERRRQCVGRMSGGERQMVAILMVEQNAKKSLELAHRAYVLAAGQNRFEGLGLEPRPAL